MKISEINQAMLIYYNWLESIGFDETEIGVIRKVIERCADVERENEELKKKLKISNQLRMIAENELKKQKQKKEDIENFIYEKTMKRMKRMGIDEIDYKRIIVSLANEIEQYRETIDLLAYKTREEVANRNIKATIG